MAIVMLGVGGSSGGKQVLSGRKDWPVKFFLTARETLSFLFFIHHTTFSYALLVLKYDIAFNSQGYEILMT